MPDADVARWPRGRAVDLVNHLDARWNAKQIVNHSIRRILRTFQRSWECPICGYAGPFAAIHPVTGKRPFAECPHCGGVERERLQKLVLDQLALKVDLSTWEMLHVAPERTLAAYFQQRVHKYETGDIEEAGVNHRIDLRRLPFQDRSYDLLFASHVLEHIDDDEAALAEIRRVLRAGGLAILPVPIVQEHTVEYLEPNLLEHGHVRAPGLDYFDKYRRHFSRVEVVSSFDFPEKYQSYIFEDRTKYPLPSCPNRKPMPGWRHGDYVPLCWV